MTRMLRLSVCAAALMAAGGAQAQTRYVVFGDSLSDNGNVYTLTGQPPSPPYNQRFSNGLVAVEYLAGPLQRAGVPVVVFGQPVNNAGSIDFAFGGARTDNAFNAQGPVPGTAAQIAAFLGRGGQFGATDRAWLFAGANNIFQATGAIAAGQPVGDPTAFVTRVATAAAGDIANQVRILAGAGARTIIVPNLPNFANLPSYTSAGAQAAQLGGFASTVFNAQLATGLGAAYTGLSGVSIVQVDTNALFNAVVASPGAFGFTNVTTPCVNGATLCGATLAEQNRNLFWDGVHPTDAGYRLLAQAVQQYLDTPDRAAAVGVLTETSLWQRRSTTQRALDRLNAAGLAVGATDFYVSGVGDYATVNGQGFKPGYTWGTGGIALGVTRRLDPAWTIGGALSAVTGEATTGLAAGNRLSYSPTSFEGDLVARWDQGAYYVSAAAGGGYTDNRDIRRQLFVGNLENTAKVGGRMASGLVEVGTTIPWQRFRVQPAARLGYLYADLDGFQESGALAPIVYGSRALSTALGGAEVRLATDLALTPERALTAYGLIGYEGFFGQDVDRVRGRLSGNTVLPFATTVADVRSPGLQLGAGLGGALGPVTVAADYRVAIGERDQIRHRAALTLRLAY